jgi:hypothetical protein
MNQIRKAWLMSDSPKCDLCDRRLKNVWALSAIYLDGYENITYICEKCITTLIQAICTKGMHKKGK